MKSILSKAAALMFACGLLLGTSATAHLPTTTTVSRHSTTEPQLFSWLKANEVQDSVRRLVSQALQAPLADNDDDDNDNDANISLPQQRRLGAFDALNDLLQGAVIRLPDVSTSTGKLKLTLKSPYCENIIIGDIILTPQMINNQRFAFKVRMADLQLECRSNYDYDWRFVDGSGRIYAEVRESWAETTIFFNSPNFSTSPPSSSEAGTCTSEVVIKDLDFSGGFVNSLLDTFEKSFRDMIANEVEEGTCAIPVATLD